MYKVAGAISRSLYVLAALLLASGYAQSRPDIDVGFTEGLMISCQEIDSTQSIELAGLTIVVPDEFELEGGPVLALNRVFDQYGVKYTYRHVSMIPHRNLSRYENWALAKSIDFESRRVDIKYHFSADSDLGTKKYEYALVFEDEALHVNSHEALNLESLVNCVLGLD